MEDNHARVTNATQTNNKIRPDLIPGRVVRAAAGIRKGI